MELVIAVRVPDERLSSQGLAFVSLPEYSI